MSRKSSSKKNNREAKRAAVLTDNKKSRFYLIAIPICLLLIGGSAALLFYPGGQNTPVFSVSAPPAQAGVEASRVAYPTALFEDGKARHYSHTAGDITIRYFILKSSDGVIRAAFDACDVCWPAGKGYYQDGDVMVCRNCGRRFASVLVNEVKGGCNPAPLNRSVENGSVILEVDDIVQGRGYFNYSGKV